MKIVYCKDSLGNAAGMERVLCTKANYFADILGYEVHIVLIEPVPSNLFFSFSSKIIIHSLNINSPKKKSWQVFFKTAFDREYKKKLAVFLQKIKPDITISMFGEEISFLYQLRDGSKKILEFHFSRNYLSHLIEGLPNSKLKWLKKLQVQLLLHREHYYASKYDHIVLLTEKDKQLWGGDKRFTVIPNPLSFLSNHSAKLESKVIVAMGRYIAQKGFDLLIQAFSLLKDEFKDWKLLIYGEGQDRVFLQQLINKLSLQENIILKKNTSDIEEIMSETSLFVLPSRYEGFGLVLIEAMECGVPCVAFDCECGPSEIIKDNEDGFLVKTGDIKELVYKMKQLMENEELRKSMGKSAKKNVTRYYPDVIMGKWNSFFLNLFN